MQQVYMIVNLPKRR